MTGNWKNAWKVAVLSGTLLLVSCKGNEGERTPKKESNEPTRVATVSAQPRSIEVPAVIRASDVAELASRFGGFISQVRIKAGKHARKGDLLVVMDDRNLQAQSDKITSVSEEMDQAIREARSQLDAAEAQKQLATNTFERIEKVYEKKAASRQEFDEAESRKKAADSAWQAASERVAQMESRRQQVNSEKKDVEANLGYVRLTAPFDGIVTSVPADEGTFASPGQVLVVMEKPSAYQVIFAVEEELLDAVGEKKKVKVSIPSMPGKSLEAVIAEVSPSLDIGARTFRVKADLNQTEGIRTGTSASISLLTKKGTSLWIPMEFVIHDHDLESVMVREGSDWNKVLVKSGRQKDGLVEILSGLNEGDKIGWFEASR